MLWRQGDILIESTASIPVGAVKQPDLVLADGEATGHRHRIDDLRSARLFDHQGELFLEVVADEATVIHDEHHPIVLKHGAYRVWRQREYSPAGQRRTMSTGPSWPATGAARDFRYVID